MHMDRDDLQAQLLHTAELLEQFRRLAEQASQSQRHSAQELHRLTDAAPQILRGAANENFALLASQLQRDLGANLERIVEATRRKLLETGQQMTQTAHQSQQAADRLHRVVRGVWMAAACSVVMLATCLGSGIWLSSHYYEEVRRHQISAELLKAYNAADVTLCAGKLCANVDARAEGFGDQRQYRPVHARP